MTPDERDPDWGDDPAEEVDADTNLILDYLANKLDPADCERLEQRAKQDKDFRYKLADIVLLKGLVTLALEKNPTPAAQACRRTQRMFLDYLKGRTNVSKTAELSRHLDECFECELAFERFQQHESVLPGEGPRKAGWRRFLSPGRHAVIAGLVALALAAGAFGVVAFLTSASASAGGLPGQVAAAAGTPDARGVRDSLEALTRADPSLDAGGALSEAVQSILDETTTPPERADLYRKLGSDFGRRVEPLLWSLARVEPIEMARTAAYQAIDPANATDAHALLAAARREAVQRTTLVHLLVPGLVERPGEDVRRLLLELVATTADSDDEWPLMNLKLIYGRLKGDPEIERRMTACLAHPSDRIRGIAALTSADAGNRAMVPVAFELLDSKDSRARFSAVLILKRHATAEEFKQILSRDWSRDEETRLAIEAAMRSRGIEPPKQL